LTIREAEKDHDRHRSEEHEAETTITDTEDWKTETNESQLDIHPIDHDIDRMIITDFEIISGKPTPLTTASTITTP